MNYLDTSMLTAYYCAEGRSPRVQSVLSHVEGPTISPLVEVEFYCAVARKVRSGTVSEPTALHIFAELQRHLAESRFQFVPIQAEQYNLAREWISRLSTPLRVLDALHMAVAFSHELCLVTSDVDLARSARHFGVRHRLIS